MTEHISERRIAREQRRLEDRKVCPFHDDIQDSTKEHRGMVCAKIASVADSVKGMTPKWVLILLIPILLAGFGWIYHSVERGLDKADAGQNEIKKSLSIIHNRITVNDESRQKADNELNFKLNDIQSDQKLINYKLYLLEKTISPNSNEKIIPNNKPALNNNK